MDPTAENVANVVAILTAILSEQEEIANELVLESDPIELFSTLAGMLTSALSTIARTNHLSIDLYLKQLGMYAAYSCS